MYFTVFRDGKITDIKPSGDTQQSHLLDLLDVNLGNPVASVPIATSVLDPWGAPPTPPQRPQVSFLLSDLIILFL